MDWQKKAKSYIADSLLQEMFIDINSYQWTSLVEMNIAIQLSASIGYLSLFWKWIMRTQLA